MVKHKSEDYKTIAVKYYLEQKDTNYTKTSKIFKCSQRSKNGEEKVKIKHVVKKKDTASVRVVALT